MRRRLRRTLLLYFRVRRLVRLATKDSHLTRPFPPPNQQVALSARNEHLEGTHRKLPRTIRSLCSPFTRLSPCLICTRGCSGSNLGLFHRGDRHSLSFFLPSAIGPIFARRSRSPSARARRLYWPIKRSGIRAAPAAAAAAVVAVCQTTSGHDGEGVGG